MSTFFTQTNPLHSSSCRMSFCHLCLRKHLQVEEPENLPEDWLCQRCNNACCCQFSFCTKDHQHCYTYRRTQQRHAQVWDAVGLSFDLFRLLKNGRKRRDLAPPKETPVTIQDQPTAVAQNLIVISRQNERSLDRHPS